MPKSLKIGLNLFLSFLVVLQSFIVNPEIIQAALPECKTVGVQILPNTGSIPKFFYKDNDDIYMTVSLLAEGSTLKTTIPTDKFSINTRFNKSLLLGIGFPDQITGTSSSFSFNRDNNITVATTKMELSSVIGGTWPIGQYEVRLIKNGSDYCTANPAIYIGPAQLVEVGQCPYSLPANIHYGDGYQRTDFKLNNIPGVVFTPLLFEGIKKDSDFTLASERDVAQSMGLTAGGAAAGAAGGAAATAGIIAAGTVPAGALSAAGAGAAAGAVAAGTSTLGVGAPAGALIGAGLGLIGGVIYNFMSTSEFRDAQAFAEKYITFDKNIQKLEIKDTIPTRDDGYTLVMSAKLENNWWLSHGLIGNQFGTACWVNRFKVTTDPTSAILKQGTYGNPENPTHAQTTTPKTAPVPANAGGKTCGDESSPGILTAIGCIHTQPVEFVKDFMKFAIGISGGLAFLLMLSGAFQMITSAGNPEALKTGQDRLTSAVIGLMLVIFATLLLQIIGVDILRIPGLSK